MLAAAHTLWSQPWFYLEATKVSKAEFGHRGPFGTANDWLKAVFDLEGTSSKYLINVGAHMTNSDIVTHAMMSNDIQGVVIDSDDPMTWAGKNIVRHVGTVTPSNINLILKRANAPRKPLLLKVDIDSFDVDVALAVLKNYTPDFIFVEINEKIPPPICYCNRYHPNWRRVDGNAYGCSLRGYELALRKKSYTLVSVMFNDALFVHKRIVLPYNKHLPKSSAAAFASGYSTIPSRKKAFFWNSGVDHWLNATRANLKEIGSEIERQLKVNEAKQYVDFALNASSWPCKRK